MVLLMSLGQHYSNYFKCSVFEFVALSSSQPCNPVSEITPPKLLACNFDNITFPPPGIYRYLDSLRHTKF